MIKYHSQFLLDKEKGKSDAKVRFRIKWNGNIIAFSLGYRVDIEKWSLEVQRCKNNTTHGKKKISASIINKKIQEFENAIEELFRKYSVEGVVPSKDVLRNDFNAFIGKSGSTEKKKETKNFYDLFDDFVKEESIKNQWTQATKTKFRTIKKHLFKFDEELDFDKLNEKKLIEYQYFLQEDIGYKNSTLLKNISFVKWFLKWSVKKGFNTNKAFELFKPKLKKTNKKVIFLTNEELIKLKKFQISEKKKYLERVRDLFLFQCFTGLRYSDVQNLRKTDIKDNHIELISIKTNDSLIIELNSQSKDILEKYSNSDFPKDKVLPTISNQKMNDYLKELMEMVGIDDPIRTTYYIGNKRYDETFPKYALISTHAGRRTFICSALSLGIPPQVVMKWTGHSDYKSMKPYIDIADTIKANAMEKFNDLI